MVFWYTILLPNLTDAEIVAKLIWSKGGNSSCPEPTLKEFPPLNEI